MKLFYPAFVKERGWVEGQSIFGEGKGSEQGQQEQREIHVELVKGMGALVSSLVELVDVAGVLGYTELYALNVGRRSKLPYAACSSTEPKLGTVVSKQPELACVGGHGRG